MEVDGDYVVMSTPAPAHRLSHSGNAEKTVPHYRMNTSSVTPARSVSRRHAGGVIHPAYTLLTPVEGIPDSPVHWASPPVLRSSMSSLASTTTTTSSLIRGKQTSLKCLLCFEFYTEPLMLPCLHSFCRKCLTDLVAQDGRDTKCPTCGAGDVLPPEGGVHSLPKNLWLGHQVEINLYQEKLGSRHGDVPCDRCVKQSNGFASVFCCQCCQFLCRSCKEDHKWCRDTVNHELVEVGRGKPLPSGTLQAATEQLVNVNPPLHHKPVICTKHSSEDYKFYCKTCEKLICQECMANDHVGHDHDYLERTAAEFRQILQEHLDKGCTASADLELTICNVEEMSQLVHDRKRMVEDEIDTSCEMLHKALDERRRILRDKCKDIATGKLDVLAAQMDEFQAMRAEIEHINEEATNAVMNQSPAEIVSIQKIIKQKMKHVLHQFEQLSLNLSADDTICTNFNTQWVAEHVLQFGCFTDLCIPEKSSIQYGLAIPRAIVGKEKSLKLVLKDEYGLPMKGTTPFQAQILGRGRNSTDSQRVEVVQNEDGTADLLFTPHSAGEYELSVKVRNEPIRGSPFSLWFRNERNYRNLGAPQVFITGHFVYGVAVDTNGIVYASNCATGCVHVFQEDGTEGVQIGCAGSSSGQLNKPWGLALDGDVLYVADRGNRRVQMFATGSGETIGQFGAAELVDPMGICLDNQGNVYVTDGTSHRVQVFDADGKHMYAIKCNTYPYDVAVDNTGHVHVAYYNNKSVQVVAPGQTEGTSQKFSFTGSLTSSIRSGSLASLKTPKTTKPPKKPKPSKSSKAKKTDQVTYHNNCCIQVFSPDGKRGLYAYTASGGLVYPTGLTIDEEGYRFISDSNHHCLRILDPNGTEINQCPGLNFPYGVTVDHTGHIYIADSSNFRIVKY